MNSLAGLKVNYAYINHVRYAIYQLASITDQFLIIMISSAIIMKSAKNAKSVRYGYGKIFARLDKD